MRTFFNFHVIEMMLGSRVSHGGPLGRHKGSFHILQVSKRSEGIGHQFVTIRGRYATVPLVLIALYFICYVCSRHRCFGACRALLSAAAGV